MVVQHKLICLVIDFLGVWIGGIEDIVLQVIHVIHYILCEGGVL